MEKKAVSIPGELGCASRDGDNTRREGLTEKREKRKKKTAHKFRKTFPESIKNEFHKM